MTPSSETPAPPPAATETPASPRPAHTHRVPDSDRVPVLQKVTYGVGGAVDWFTVGMSGRLFMPVFNLGFGMAPQTLGLIMMLYRIWDAVTDPVMGNLSDNTRTRWGRRRPYIFIGALLVAAVTPMLYRPPDDLSPNGMAGYVLALGLLMYTCSTIWSMAYNCLMLEMTPHYDERTRISAYRTVFGKFGALIGGWVIPLASSPLFFNAQGETDLVRGVQVISLWMSGLVVVLGILPAVFNRERYYEKEVVAQARESLVQGLRETIRLKPLWLMTGFVVLQVFGSSITGALGFYINIYYISGGELLDASIIEGLKDTTGFLMGLAAVPFWTWVCERLDKKWTMMIIIGSGFIGAALNVLCLNPDYPYLQIVPAVFYASVVASIWLIVPSMLADMVDYDELQTGRRREGSINAVFSWFLKLGMTLPVGLSGFVLAATGFDTAAGREQPPEVLHRMLWSFILLPLIFWGTALVLLWFYPLNREKMQAIRTQLEQRRGKI
jgi:GPH family glycoside/pentoside/hexuronide:cation symporter